MNEGSVNNPVKGIQQMRLIQVSISFHFHISMYLPNISSFLSINLNYNNNNKKHVTSCYRKQKTHPFPTFVFLPEFEPFDHLWGIFPFVFGCLFGGSSQLALDWNMAHQVKEHVDTKNHKPKKTSGRITLQTSHWELWFLGTVEKKQNLPKKSCWKNQPYNFSGCQWDFLDINFHFLLQKIKFTLGTEFNTVADSN